MLGGGRLGNAYHRHLPVLYTARKKRRIALSYRVELGRSTAKRGRLDPRTLEVAHMVWQMTPEEESAAKRLEDPEQEKRRRRKRKKENRGSEHFEWPVLYNYIMSAHKCWGRPASVAVSFDGVRLSREDTVKCLIMNCFSLRHVWAPDVVTYTPQTTMAGVRSVCVKNPTLQPYVKLTIQPP